MRSALEDRGISEMFHLDSAGTGGWQVGHKPDRRMRAAAKVVGRRIRGSARQVCEDDFDSFDWIFCMDQDNYENIMAIGANPKKTHVLLEFIEHVSEREVPDPYFGGEDGFANVIALIDGAVSKLIDRLHTPTQ